MYYLTHADLNCHRGNVIRGLRCGGGGKLLLSYLLGSQPPPPFCIATLPAQGSGAVQGAESNSDMVWEPVAMPTLHRSWSNAIVHCWVLQQHWHQALALQESLELAPVQCEGGGGTRSHAGLVLLLAPTPYQSYELALTW